MGHASLIYDEMTGMENLAYFAALYAIKDTERSTEALVSVGLDPSWRFRRAITRRGCASAFLWPAPTVHDPQIILLDEPFSNVDPDSSAQITERLKNLARAGKTIVSCDASTSVARRRSRRIPDHLWPEGSLRAK